MNLETGDWIVYTQNERTRPRGSQTLGGPWSYAKLVKKGVSGWTVKPPNGSDTFVLERDVVAVTMSRGEAIIIVDKLTTIQVEYITERDALKPRFQDRVDALLKNA